MPTAIHPSRCLRIAAAWLGLLCSSWAVAAELRVAVASNFLPTAEVLARRFEQHTPHAVAFSSASTGKLYAQIVNGAPYDVLLAADRERPERLEQEGRAQPGTRFTYALGRLVLWSPDPDRIDPDGKALLDGRVRRLAIANPELAPYGRAARETLQHMGLWDALEPRLVRGENIAQAFLFTRSGGAEMGLVSQAQVLLVADRSPGSSWAVPARYHAPIEQQAVRLSERDGAIAWLSFLASDEGRAVIVEHGYDLP